MTCGLYLSIGNVWKILSVTHLMYVPYKNRFSLNIHIPPFNLNVFCERRLSTKDLNFNFKLNNLKTAIYSTVVDIYITILSCDHPQYLASILRSAVLRVLIIIFYAALFFCVLNSSFNDEKQLRVLLWV